MRSAVLLAFCGLSIAQTGQTEKKQRARELLDAAAEMTGAAQPQVQIAALMHLGEAYKDFDSKRAMELLEQAFAAAGVLPEIHGRSFRRQMQAQVVARAAGVDLKAAAAMFRQIDRPTEDGLDRLVRGFAGNKDFPPALQLIEHYRSATNEFPYRAVDRVLGRLAPDDPRAAALLDQAMAAFRSKPERGLGNLLSTRYRSIPAESLTAAVSAYTTWILEQKPEGFYTANVHTEKGAAAFTTKADYDLFEVWHVVRNANPKEAEKILRERPLLNAMVAKYPDGLRSLRAADDSPVSRSVSSGSGDVNPRDAVKAQMDALSASRRDAALNMIREDPAKAIEMAAEIAAPDMRAELLAGVVTSLGAKDPAKARPVLNQCEKLVKDIDSAANRATVHIAVAEGWHTLQDHTQAWAAYKRAVSAALELLKSDTNSDEPNEALREEWPSTQMGRRIVHSAAKKFGVNAEPVLFEVLDPEMNLLLRVELARALLGRDFTDVNTSVMRSGKKR